MQAKEADAVPASSSPSEPVASAQLPARPASPPVSTVQETVAANTRSSVSPAASDLSSFTRGIPFDGTWSLLDGTSKATDERDQNVEQQAVGMPASKSTVSSVGATEQLAAKTQQAAYNAWHAESADQSGDGTVGDDGKGSSAAGGDEEKLVGQGLAANPFLGMMKPTGAPPSALFPSQGMFASASLFPKPILQQPHPYVFPQQPPAQPRPFSHDFLASGFGSTRTISPYMQPALGTKQQPQLMVAANLQSSSAAPGVMQQPMSARLPQPVMLSSAQQRPSLVRSGAYAQGQSLPHHVSQLHASAQAMQGVGSYLKQQPSQQAQVVRIGSMIPPKNQSEMSKLAVDAKPFTPSSGEQVAAKYDPIGQRSQNLPGMTDLAQQSQQAVYGSRAAHVQAQAALNANKMALAQMPPQFSAQQQQYSAPFQQGPLPGSFTPRHPPPVQHPVLGQQQHMMAQRVVAGPHSMQAQSYAMQGLASQHQHTAGLIGPPPVGAPPAVSPGHAFVHPHSSTQRQSNLSVQHTLASHPIMTPQAQPDPQKQLMREQQKKCLMETSTYMREQREKEEIARHHHAMSRLSSDPHLPMPVNAEGKMDTGLVQKSEGSPLALPPHLAGVAEPELKAAHSSDNQSTTTTSRPDTAALPPAMESNQVPLLDSVSSSVLPTAGLPPLTSDVPEPGQTTGVAEISQPAATDSAQSQPPLPEANSSSS